MKAHSISVGIFLLAIWCGPAGASSINLSNPFLRSWNGIIVHEPGAAFSSFLVNDAVVTSGPDAELATDLGFASASALSQPLSLSPSSAVDGTGISSLGYDYVIAEGSARYEADLVVTGGSGAVEVLLEAFESATSSTNEPGFALASVRTIRIREGGSIIYGISSTAESGLVALEYGVTYRLQMSLTAYSRATVGHETSHSRELQLALSVVPEPKTAALLAVGLGLLSSRKRRLTRRCS